MGKIFDVATNFFRKDDWPFTRLGGESILQTGFRGESGRWNCFAQAREEQAQFVFYSVCPVNAPEKKGMAVAELLTWANYDMIYGDVPPAEVVTWVGSLFRE